MNKYMDRAKTMREQLNILIKDFNDETAIANKELYPDWNGNGIPVVRGELLYYNKNLYRVNQSHTTQDDWTPDITPALYTKISLEEYPQWRQPTGAHDAYNKGDKVSDEGKHWISNKDGNVYKPGLVPGDWSEVA